MLWQKEIFLVIKRKIDDDEGKTLDGKCCKSRDMCVNGRKKEKNKRMAFSYFLMPYITSLMLYAIPTTATLSKC